MSQNGSANSLLYFINTTFNYPTMAERIVSRRLTVTTGCSDPP